jgi:hypothetical protein
MTTKRIRSTIETETETKDQETPPAAHVAQDCLLWTKDEPKRERGHCILDFELKCEPGSHVAVLLTREQALNLCADLLDSFGIKKLEVPEDDPIPSKETLQ